MSNFQSNEFICNFTMIVRLKSGFSPGKKQQILFLLVKLLSLVDFAKVAQVSAIGFVIIKAIYTHYGQINIFLVFS